MPCYDKVLHMKVKSGEIYETRDASRGESKRYLLVLATLEEEKVRVGTLRENRDGQIEIHAKSVKKDKSGEVKTYYLENQEPMIVRLEELGDKDSVTDINQVANKIKESILIQTSQFASAKHADKLPRTPTWNEGDSIPYAGRVFDENEVIAAVNSSLDFWLTLGEEGKLMEEELALKLGCRSSMLVNSGSSANLIAISTLTSPKIEKERRLNPGDEVITVAAGFPTTIAPILQNKCKPVFLDVDPLTCNIDVVDIEAAVNIGKTKAIILAHTLGNPFDIYKVKDICKKYNLWLIEDNCDALGASYAMPKKIAEEFGITTNSPGLDCGDDMIIRYTGAWGDISTQSFYPPHHLTMGEGGAVNIVSSAKLRKIAESFRDWGRDCWCPSGKDNTCGKRYEMSFNNLPDGYDHKYVYSHFGYNLKPLDLQAAIGRIQLNKLESYISARNKNWNYLREKLRIHENVFDFASATHEDGVNTNGCIAKPSWFGYMLIIKDPSKISRRKLLEHLEKNKIGNRLLFGGNMLRQPLFENLDTDMYKVIKDELKGSDILSDRALFIGVFPGMSEKMLDKIVECISEFVANYD